MSLFAPDAASPATICERVTFRLVPAWFASSSSDPAAEDAAGRSLIFTKDNVAPYLTNRRFATSAMLPSPINRTKISKDSTPMSQLRRLLMPV
jgi:hypothetical protein